MKTLKNLESFGEINKTYFVNCSWKWHYPIRYKRHMVKWKSQKSRSQKTWYDINLLHTTFNYLQNILRPIYKIVKVELLWRVSWLILSSFLTPFSDFYFWKENWALGYTSTRFWCSLKISSISKFLSFKSFSRYWGDPYIQFLVI